MPIRYLEPKDPASRGVPCRFPSPDPSLTFDTKALRREAKNLISREIVQHCALAWDQRVWAVVLTGSLARNEATFVHDGSDLKLLGDADCFILFRRSADMPSGAETAAVESKIGDSLAKGRMRAKVGLSCVLPHFFESLPPLISTFELRNRGEVLWGDSAALSLVPNFSVNSIPREDAWRMLCNRMIEFLSFVGEVKASTAELSPDLHYATVKLLLDLATSYLVFSGHYAPSYRERAQNLSILAEKDAIEAPFSLKEFSARVAQCTSWKISGEDSECKCGIELWRDAITYLRELWRWEARQLATAREDLSDAELWNLLARQLTVRQKLRGWASLMKRSGWSKSWRNWPRWVKLSIRATPRYWIYRAGMEIAFNLPALIAARTAGTGSAPDYLRIASTLPTDIADIKSGEEVWRSLAGKIASNYWKYLAGTRT